MKQAKHSLAPVRLTLRFYPGQDDELLRWLDELDWERSGAKNQAVKNRLRIAMGPDTSPTATTASVPDRAPDLTVLLAEVRKVVEAAVASALGRFANARQIQGVVAGVDATASADDDDEVEGLLQALDQALVLE
jgi:hypothetical protein